MTSIDITAVAAEDLARHLDQRIEMLLHQYMDRCATVGVEYEDATMKAITVLGHYFTIAAAGADATEDEIIATCQWHFDKMKRRAA